MPRGDVDAGLGIEQQDQLSPTVVVTGSVPKVPLGDRSGYGALTIAAAGRLDAARGRVTGRGSRCSSSSLAQSLVASACDQCLGEGSPHGRGPENRVQPMVVNS